MAARLAAINSRNQAKARMRANRRTGRAMYGKAAFLRKCAVMQRNRANAQLLALVAPPRRSDNGRTVSTRAESHHAADQGQTDLAVAHSGCRSRHGRGVAG